MVGLLGLLVVLWVLLARHQNLLVLTHQARKPILILNSKMDSTDSEVILRKHDVIRTNSILLHALSPDFDIAFPFCTFGANHATRCHNEFLNRILQQIH